MHFGSRIGFLNGPPIEGKVFWEKPQDILPTGEVLLMLEPDALPGQLVISCGLFGDKAPWENPTYALAQSEAVFAKFTDRDEGDIEYTPASLTEDVDLFVYGRVPLNKTTVREVMVQKCEIPEVNRVIEWANRNQIPVAISDKS